MEWSKEIIIKKRGEVIKLKKFICPSFLHKNMGTWSPGSLVKSSLVVCHAIIWMDERARATIAQRPLKSGSAPLHLHLIRLWLGVRSDRADLCGRLGLRKINSGNKMQRKGRDHEENGPYRANLLNISRWGETGEATPLIPQIIASFFPTEQQWNIYAYQKMVTLSPGTNHRGLSPETWV